jgi:hypothetical protein
MDEEHGGAPFSRDGIQKCDDLILFLLLKEIRVYILVVHAQSIQ